MNERGYTSLLIAAHDGIQFLTVGESTSKDKPGKLLFNAPMFKDIRQLSVAQDKEDVTIWFRTPIGELGYTRTKSGNLAGDAVSSLLLPAGSSSTFAPAVTGPSDLTGQAVRQMVISNDRQGNLMLIEQSDDVGLWRKTPFFAPSKSTPTELKSYTVTIKASDADKRPLSNGSVLISATASVSVILNGQNTLLTRVPSWYDCDQGGSLDFIVPSDSLGSQGLRIESLKNQTGDILDFDYTEYDPAAKPMAKLAQKLASLELKDFKTLQTSTGEQLFDADVQKDEKTMTSAKECLGSITQAYSKVTKPQTVSKLSANTSTTATLVNAAKSASNDFGDTLMDAWFWVREMVDKATEWVVDTAGTFSLLISECLLFLIRKILGSVWRFVCTIAGQVKQFVLDTVEKICEAATWVCLSKTIKE